MANEFMTDEHTDVLQKLVNELQNDPDEYIGRKYLPSVQVPTSKIRVEVLEAFGGLTNEHVVGTQPEYIQKPGSKVIEFTPAAFKEGVHFDEREILNLRELGKNDRSQRGIRQYIDRSVNRLNLRMEARMELLRWQTLLAGGYSFMGETLSFGVPSANVAVPRGAKWSLNGIDANDLANPIKDLRYWMLGGYATFRKFKFKEIVMGPNTARWILDNANTQSLIQYHFGSDKYELHDVPNLLKFLIPGLPPVIIYSGWYREETVVNKKITVGDATYFMTDGSLFFAVEPYPGGEAVGEFVQSLNLATGTVDQPGVGKFLVVEDNTLPGTKGGPANPYMDIWGGFYGSPKLDLPQNVCTAYVL